MRQLFGVDVPPMAARAVVRPVLSRGGALPLFDGRISEETTDTDVVVAAARNTSFWEYIDLQVRARRIEAPADGVWNWKLRVVLYNAEGQASDPFTTTETHEFYRGTKSGGGGTEADDALLRVMTFAQTALTQISNAAVQAIQAVQTAGAQSQGETSKASAQALAEVAKAATGAIAEASKASATALAEASKQTEKVSQLADKLFNDGENLKATVFRLLDEKAKGGGAAPVAPKGVVDEIKEVTESVRALKGLVDTFAPDEGKPAPNAQATDKKG